MITGYMKIERKVRTMKLETAIDKCFDRCNLMGEDVDIQKYMYQYKAIRELPDDQFDQVYDEIARRLGFTY